MNLNHDFSKLILELIKKEGLRTFNLGKKAIRTTK